MSYDEDDKLSQEELLMEYIYTAKSNWIESTGLSIEDADEFWNETIKAYAERMK